MELIPVMIVDDEILAVNNLKSLVPWEEHGFRIVAEATTVNRAVEYFNRFNPQIIFMDIRMPVKSGLELSRDFLNADGNVKIVLLTSYEDFDYAKSAVGIGVFDYLLKHETESDLLVKELVKLKNELEFEKRKNMSETRQFLRDLLENRYPADHAVVKHPSFLRGGGYNVFLYLKTDTPYPVIGVGSLQTHTPPSLDLDQLSCYSFPDGFTYVGTVPLGINSWGVVFTVLKNHSQRQVWENVYMASCFIQREFRQQCTETVSIITSMVFKNPEELPQIYHKIKLAENFLPLMGKEKIIRFQDLNFYSASSAAPESRNIFPEIVRSLSRLDSAETIKLIDSAFSASISSRYNFKDFRGVCNKLSDILENFREIHNLPSLTGLAENGQLDMSQWYGISSIHKWFINEFEGSILSVKNNIDRCYSKKVQEAISFIDRNYAKNLTIDTISNALFISGAHLRSIFKEETGQTLIDYLTKCRIEKAKELISCNKYKIYEISEMIGYQTGQYFSQVFRRFTGLSPQEYQEYIERSVDSL